MDIVWASLLVLVVGVSWFATLIGLPGNWIIVGATAVYVYFGPQEGHWAIGLGVLGILLASALLGEIAEALAAALGVTGKGGSKRGAMMALLGSLAGGVAGLFVGTPIPVIGSVVASLALAAFGALVGAVIGEQWAGKNLTHSLKIGEAAFWGRMMGTLAKLLFGAVMVTVVCVALLRGA